MTPIMIRKITFFSLIFFLLTIALVSLFTIFSSPRARAESEPEMILDDEHLLGALQELRQTTGLVGVGGLIMVDGEIIARAATGERKKGSAVSVSADDQWHLGSITKSMTATMLAILVEEGTLGWQMTLPEMLPNMPMDAAWQNVTLHNLVTHTAGMQANFPMRTQFVRPDDLPSLHEARRKALAALLAKPPKHTPGEDFVYSNAGFTLAGFIAAERMDQPWETLMRERLFDPLGLSSAGFGPPHGSNAVDQPWGHSKLFFMKSAKDPLFEGADNTPVMGPAGIVHMSMADLATYGNEHLKGERGASKILTAASFKQLHTPFKEDYASGLVVVERDWAGGQLIWHNGSNTMWYAIMLLLPEKNTVLIFVTNDGDIKKADAAFGKLAKRIALKIDAWRVDD